MDYFLDVLQASVFLQPVLQALQVLQVLQVHSHLEPVVLLQLRLLLRVML
jgi:hypothetical protein